VGLSFPAWSETWQEIAGDLMSPACPGRTLLNCTSSQAEQWRELIRQKLDQGESRNAILQYFVDMSGEGILAAPPKEGFALAAWLLPLFFIVNGTGLILVLTRQWARKRPAVTAQQTIAVSLPPAPEPLSADPYLDRLRRELQEFNQ
jgi:cytochrome c-type biogenesis protein CcmH